MKNIRFAGIGILTAMLLTASLAQKAAPHLLSGEELTKVVPAEFFFAGQKAATQMRNATGFEAAEGKVVFAALVDTSGYSTAVQQKYQGLFVSETKLNIGGSELTAGAYGFGFEADKFVVMNVADQDLLGVPFQTDTSLKRPVPLKFVEEGGAYKLYAGRKWIAVKPE